MVDNTPAIVTEDLPHQYKKREPVLAALLSLILPGLGQLYNGQPGKAFLFFILQIFTVYFGFMFTLFIDPLPASIFTILVGSFILIFMLTNAFVNARRKKEYILKPYNRWYFYLLIYIGFYIGSSTTLNIYKSSVLEAYRIPTGSMESTILPGDFVISNKIKYGFYNPFSRNYIGTQRIPERNDIVIFSYLYENSSEVTTLVKRCIGLPGEELSIISQLVQINGQYIDNPRTAILNSRSKSPDLIDYRMFPKGSTWNEDNYGPIRIPKQGDVMTIIKDSSEAWRNFIINDNNGDNKKFDEAVTNGSYTVKKDYLFLMGDNRNNSLDSRYIGFIAVEDIIGTADWIYFSMDPDSYSIRTDRIGKVIE